MLLSPACRMANASALSDTRFWLSRSREPSTLSNRSTRSKARSNVIDMVITDLNMPVMDGLTLIRELRKLPALRGVPIVFLTTESDPGMKQQAKAAGATGWITKPFQQAQLIALARKVLGA